MTEAEGSWEGGLDTPIQGWVGALQTLSPVMTRIRGALILIHFAQLSAEAWGAHENIRKHEVSRQLPWMTQANPETDANSGCRC